jgi:hypothetical protein
MIGLSVSHCIKDIISGLVEERSVEKIIARTECYDNHDWASVIKRYRARYWGPNPELGEAICWRFIAEGKIEQPRCEGKPPLDIYTDGHWRQ